MGRHYHPVSAWSGQLQEKRSSQWMQRRRERADLPPVEGLCEVGVAPLHSQASGTLLTSRAWVEDGREPIPCWGQWAGEGEGHCSSRGQFWVGMTENLHNVSNNNIIPSSEVKVIFLFPLCYKYTNGSKTKTICYNWILRNRDILFIFQWKWPCVLNNVCASKSCTSGTLPSLVQWYTTSTVV